MAFDPKGNLWVANYGTSNGGPNGSIAEYVGGVQNTNATITNGILGPEAIAVDTSGDVWVNNDSINVTVYGPLYANGYPINPIKTINTGSFVYAVLPALGVLICLALLTRVDFSKSLILLAVMLTAGVNWLLVRGRGTMLKEASHE